MKVAYSSLNLISIRRGFSTISEKLQSYPQLKYLFAVPFLVVIAFGSYRAVRLSGNADMNIRDTDLIRQKREVVDSKGTARENVESYGGATYIRWGRNVCSPGSEALYRGVAGGSLYSQHGGGSNYLCLPLDPIWGAYNEAVAKYSQLHGSEYEMPFSFSLKNNHNRPLHDNNVPCVVCRSQTKTSVVMIPARNQCYRGMHTEYTGYLMSGASVHPGRAEFVCMDGEPESDPSGFRNEDGALFYNVEGVCGALPCPPYAPRRELTCVVCTK